MAKVKKMCKWGKGGIEKDFDKFTDMVRKPAYACGKCGRVARVKKAVCKPVAL
jgi:hypothetical protein